MTKPNDTAMMTDKKTGAKKSSKRKNSRKKEQGRP